MSVHNGFGKVLAIFLVVSASAGCSTIIEGRSQELVINTDPPGATCALSRSDLSIGNVSPTPGAVIVSKTKTDILIKCTKEGYQETAFINKSGSAGTSFGNVVPIGYAIDSASGADNKYDSPVIITMLPDEEPVASGRSHHARKKVEAKATEPATDPAPILVNTADGITTEASPPPEASAEAVSADTSQAEAAMVPEEAPQPQAAAMPDNEPQPQVSTDLAVPPPDAGYEESVNNGAEPEEETPAPIVHHRKKTVAKTAPAAPAPPIATAAPVVAPPQPEVSIEPTPIQLGLPTDKSAMVSDKE